MVLIMAEKIILKPNEACLYKETCPFNKKPDQCYGALNRNNYFICNLEELKLMFPLEDQEDCDIWQN